MSGKLKTGVRAITLQQPYAAAVAAGACQYTRRGKATKFVNDQEWVAIHCGKNNEHLNNGATMKGIRSAWPACPSDRELKAVQGSIVGFARFVDGNVAATSTGPKTCTFMKLYDCSKPICWHADQGVRFAVGEEPPYKKGNLQIWNLYDEDFVDKAQGGKIFREKLAQAQPC